MKITHLVAFIMLGVLTLLVGLYAYWSFEGTLFHRVLNVDAIEFQTTKTEYTNEETVEGKFSLCKYRDIPPIVQWSLIDTYLRTYPARIASSNRVQCFDNTITDIEMISPTLPAGDYYFSGTLVYQINPIKKIVVPMKTNKFQVVSDNERN